MFLMIAGLLDKTITRSDIEMHSAISWVIKIVVVFNSFIILYISSVIVSLVT